MYATGIWLFGLLEDFEAELYTYVVLQF